MQDSADRHKLEWFLLRLAGNIQKPFKELNQAEYPKLRIFRQTPRTDKYTTMKG